MTLVSFVQIFGAAGTTFYIMWLWLKSVRAENTRLKERLDSLEDKRVIELKEMLPLLTDASKGLQDVIKSNHENNYKVVEKIKRHLNDKTTEIIKEWKKS